MSQQCTVQKETLTLNVFLSLGKHRSSFCFYLLKEDKHFLQSYNSMFKGIVSRDFEWLQMILMDRIGVPDVPLEVYSFLKLHLHIVF